MALDESKPQSEVIFNKVLPYSDRIDVESQRLLNDIKENLGKALLLREIRPGAGIWADLLFRYVRVFGLKFSKEDHLAFIHVMYELVTLPGTPGLEPNLLNRFCMTLTTLLRKKELISPEELTLPWKPLFDICRRLFVEKPATPYAYRYMAAAEEVRSSYREVDKLISNCKKVFVKAPFRVQKLQGEAPSLPLPPKPVITRWGTWLDAAVYCCNNLDVVEKTVKSFNPAESSSIKTTQDLFSSTTLKADLAYITSNLNSLCGAIMQLEVSGAELSDALGVVKCIEQELKHAKGTIASRVCRKLENVPEKNSGLVYLRGKSYILCGNPSSADFQEFSPESKHSSSVEYAAHPLIEVSFGGTIEELMASYFPLEATQEILDRIRPNMCPFNNGLMVNTMSALEWFLPVALSPENSIHGYKLWFEEFMHMWTMFNNDLDWECDMMWLMARLARHNIGYIDWEPYIPAMFNRFLRAFGLPVVYKRCNANDFKIRNLDTSSIALWIVYVLGGNSSCRKYFSKFMAALDFYYYPTNFGIYSLKMADFLQDVSLYFVQRLNLERYKKLTWETRVKDSHRLTEDDITMFVETLKPILLNAMFSRLVPQVCETFHHLATLRPKLIIEPVIERFNIYDDRMTEPHKLQATMDCLVVLVRPMIEGKFRGYPEGRQNIIPLMMNFLPGIDPNDSRKTVTAFLFYGIVFQMVPIVDSSQAVLYRDDLTEEEKELCAETARFEEFVAGFVDRCFQVITNCDPSSRFDAFSLRNGSSEPSFEQSLFLVFSGLLSQTSSCIFKIALKKLISFIKGNVFELDVSGEYLAIVCQAYVRARPRETLAELIPLLCTDILERLETPDVALEPNMDNMFLYQMLFNSARPRETLAELIPLLCTDILERLETPDVALEPNMDNMFLYQMLLLSKTVCTAGIIPHLPVLTSVLDRTLHLSCRKACALATEILGNIMVALSNTEPTEPQNLDADMKDYLGIRDWGKFRDIDDLEIQWQVPGSEEVHAASNLLSRYLPTEIAFLNSFIENDVELNREALYRCLDIIIALLCCKPLLPVWDEPAIALVDSVLLPCAFVLPNGDNIGIVTMPGGENVRKTLVEIMHRLQEKMLLRAEDDTQAFSSLILIWNSLLHGSNTVVNPVDVSFNQYRLLKKVQRNILLGEKKHLRSILVQRARLQHDLLCDQSIVHLTATHGKIIKNLLKLSVSHYGEIRRKAQEKLYSALEYFTDSYLLLTDDVIQYLRADSNQFHEQFKGVLHVVLGIKSSSLLTVADWHHLSRLWPAIVDSVPSEKLSIVKLIQNICVFMPKLFPTVGVIFKVSDGCIAAARRLHKEPLPEDQGIERENERNEFNLSCVRQLETSLLNCLARPDLHWRLRKLGMIFLRCLNHPDLDYSERSVELFTESLISEDLFTRKTAIRSMVYILSQQKQKHTRIPIDPSVFPGDDRDSGATGSFVNPGVRQDNRWLLYNSKTVPVNEEQWNEPRFVHKLHIGYYFWPRELLVYAPMNLQPELDRTSSELLPCEGPIDKFFSDPEKVKKFMYFLSLEEKKGCDKFSGLRFLMFKGLFRNHGDRYLQHFLEPLNECTNSRLESYQRAATEVISGIVRGSKVWSYEKTVSLWKNLLPLISQGLSNIREETLVDWGICIATSAEGRDPNRNHWFLEMIINNPIRDEASHISCGRLYALQGALAQLQWRIPELFFRLLEFLKPYLSHPFQNIRERVGSMLSNIFDGDSVFFEEESPVAPRVADLVDYILPKLEILTKDAVKAGTPGGSHDIAEELIDVLDELATGDRKKGPKVGLGTSSGAAQPEKLPGKEVEMCGDEAKLLDEEKKVAVRLLKTVCRWISATVNRTPFGMSPHLYRFLFVLCLMESAEGDEELNKLCTSTLGALCFCKVLPQHMPGIIASLQSVSVCGSWTARVSCLTFIQIFVYRNLFIIMDNKTWITQITQIVLRLLEDDWSDVRIKASEALGVLFYTDLIENKDSLLEEFKERANFGKKKKKKMEEVPMTAAMVNLRHSGILGLCAYVDAYPYSIPEPIPDLLLFLSAHLYDPAPIPAAINKCLSAFKRSHRQMTVELDSLSEQLREVLKDGTVPPSYIA
ncbi:proteasome activator complex subunit 4A [Anabrus simplex]|uniref:proteasome activator complex subunit 4A n=1 Tax=Anabrus simplex TaxID=316456 RepID=UPI0035A2A1C9